MAPLHMMLLAGEKLLSKFRVTVVAGVIEQEGLILIGQRKPEDKHGMKWEFPGGKVEAGESTREALQRELEEELCIQAVIGDEIARYEYQYRNRTPILLVFHRVEKYQGEPRCSEFNAIQWTTRESLPDFDFLEGDIDFVRRLAAHEL
jgi:8-oxo-dGTP diphosphatase